MSDPWTPVWTVGRTVVEPGRFYAVRGDRWVEPTPYACRNGHRLSGGRVLVGSRPCGPVHGHHRTFLCRICEREIIWPPVDDDICPPALLADLRRSDPPA
ncbi:hypothetical protein [Nocardia salmonicida]|uniref:hypothetical protein n=1 Tax=Nocardia salmonicida TaxID=53431 RepID=UPI0037B8E8AA